MHVWWCCVGSGWEEKNDFFAVDYFGVELGSRTFILELTKTLLTLNCPVKCLVEGPRVTPVSFPVVAIVFC